MKHILYLNAREFAYDGELPCTHAVIGQRDIAKERVDLPDPATMTPAQYALRAKFVRDEIAGRYAVKPLEWAEDEKEAQELAAHFLAAGWLNVRIVPVDTVIENA